MQARREGLRQASKDTSTILITGSESVTGNMLLKSLDRDPLPFKRVIAVDLARPSFTLKQTQFYRLNLIERSADSDLLQILEREKVDTVVHAAFPITPPRNLEFAHELISIGTMYVINACAAAGVKHLVLISTADVYGAFPDNPNFLTEDHPPRASRLSHFLRDKIDAERQVLAAGQKYRDMTVTVLRLSTILGPTVNTYKTRYLSRKIVPTILGYDPLMQFIHEDDVVSACRLAVSERHDGVFNLAGSGVMPLSRVIALCGKINLPLPHAALHRTTQTLWYLDVSPAPATHLNFIKYSFLIDPSRAINEMGFKPKFTTREALLSFAGAERLRDIHLIEPLAST